MLALYRHVNASYNKIHRRNSSNASVLSFRRVEFMMLCFVSLRLCLCLWVLKASHRKEPIALPCVLADNEGWMDYAVYLHPPLCHLSTCLHVAGMSLGLKPYWCECSASVSVYLLLVCLSAPPPPSVCQQLQPAGLHFQQNTTPSPAVSVVWMHQHLRFAGHKQMAQYCVAQG